MTATPPSGTAIASVRTMSGTAETLIIGASAAGLATAAELRRLCRRIEIVEGEDVVATSWRRHYDRTHLAMGSSRFLFRRGQSAKEVCLYASSVDRPGRSS